MNIGVKRKTVLAAADAIAMILDARVEDRTKRAALRILERAITVSDITVKDCTFGAIPEPIVDYTISSEI